MVSIHDPGVIPIIKINKNSEKKYGKMLQCTNSTKLYSITNSIYWVAQGLVRL